MGRVLEILTQYLDLAQQETASGSVPLIIAGLVVSLLICFLGYRLVRAMVALIGFGFGAVAGMLVAQRFFDNDVITLLIAVIVGFFIAMLAVYIYSMGVFLVCFFCGAAAAAPFAFRFVTDQKVCWIVLAAVGLVFAILGTIFLKPLIIVLTSIEGGCKAAQYMAILIPFQASWFLPALSVGMAALGILIQFLTTRNYKVSRSGDRISKY